MRWIEDVKMVLNITWTVAVAVHVQQDAVDARNYVCCQFHGDTAFGMAVQRTVILNLPTRNGVINKEQIRHVTHIQTGKKEPGLLHRA